MRAFRSAVAAVLVVASQGSALAEPDALRCEARGGASWREYRSAHFVVDTDLSGVRGEALVRQLEQLHALVVQALVGDQAEIPGKVRVVAFADPADFRRIARENAVGYFRVDPLSRPTIVLAADGFQADPEVVAHELAHHVSWYLFPRQPLWFAEGLAQFIQTVGKVREQTSPRTGTHIVRGGREAGGRWAGLAPAEFVRFLHEQGGGVPDDLLTWVPGPPEQVADRHYAWSWLLYHWIWNTRPKAFTDFTRRLANAEAPGEAWRAAFPDLDPSTPDGKKALSDALEIYRRGGRFAAYEVKAPFDGNHSVVPLSSAEVHVALFLARARSPDRRAKDPDLEEAGREDPLHPLVLWGAGDGDRRAAMRKATAARPDDWRAWALLSETLSSEPERAEREAAARRALSLDPDGAFARNALAWTLFEAGRSKEALPHANAAVDLAPWSPAAIDTLAAVASALGKCREAGVLEKRAIALLGRATPRRAEYEKRLAEIEARCGSPAAAR